MPNSGRCVPVYLCVALYIVKGHGDRQISLIIHIVGVPNADSALCAFVEFAAAERFRTASSGAASRAGKHWGLATRVRFPGAGRRAVA
jgi:hypothetical protein